MIDTLRLLDLNSKEIKFFEVCFKSGPLPINEAAKLALLKRATAYLIVDSLKGKGLLKEDYKQYGKKIYTVEPAELLKILSRKQRTLRRQEVELEEKLPELQAVYQASEIRPHVRVFEGNNGLLAVWKDILGSEGEILLWTNQETETQFFNENLHNKFIKERVSKKLPIKVLAVNNNKGKLSTPEDVALLRQTRWLPKDVSFSAETYIYDNKVAVLDYKKDIVGVIIESLPIFEAQKAIFEMSWQKSDDEKNG